MKTILHNFRTVTPLAFALAILVSPLHGQDSAADKKDQERTEIKAEIVDGKVHIILPNGEEKVIELKDGANSVVVQTKVENKDGVVSGMGRAILFGPDGVHHVILDGDTSEFRDNGNLDEILVGMKGMFEVQDFTLDRPLSAVVDQNSFKVGIECEELPGVIKAQLKLHHGLVISKVFEGSAAEKAGLKEHDIVVTARGQELNDTEQLITIIQEAGENESDVDISVIRQGDEVKISITPQKDEDVTLRLQGIWPMPGEVLTDEGGVFDLQFQRAMPGMIQTRSLELTNDKLATEIAELREMIEQLRDEVRKNR